MTTTIRAHFDGKNSLVLDGPVDLPIGKPLTVHIEPLNDERIPEAQGHRLLGALKGKISMADDFNEPLEDFKDYM